MGQLRFLTRILQGLHFCFFKNIRVVQPNKSNIRQTIHYYKKQPGGIGEKTELFNYRK